MKQKKVMILTIVFLLFITSCLFSQNDSDVITGNEGSRFVREDKGTFNEPWAMTFIPDGRLLITVKSGTLYLYDHENGDRQTVSGVPEVAYGGQGGLGDIILHPDFENNSLVYLSYAEAGTSGTRGAAVARARLVLAPAGTSLEDFTVIWRQEPKVSGNGHYSHRLAFGPKGYLFITSGERQKLDPAQDWTQSLGKIIRLNDDGTVPENNPFQNRGELAKSFWTLGHRNMLGIAFDEDGRLWVHEMGPRHGDELNLIVKGENYGWPEVSWGNHYSGADIPDHDTRPEFRQPEEYWVPSIAPSGMIIYDGDLFETWRGDAFIGGLVSEALVRVDLRENGAAEVERFDMGSRIREVEQGPDGAIWLLEDRNGARLLKLTPE